MGIERQAKRSLAAAGIFAILERERAAVGLGDLPAENQSNSTAARFGGEERDEQIVAVQQARPLIADKDLERMPVHLPAHLNRARGPYRRIERGIHGVS